MAGVLKPFRAAVICVQSSPSAARISLLRRRSNLPAHSRWSVGRRAARLLHGPACIAVTPLRPRRYDPSIVAKAIQQVTDGESGVSLRIVAYSCFYDCQRFSEALEALEAAAAIYEKASPPLAGEPHPEFVFGFASLKQDANRARFWWQRFEAKNPKRSSDYWRAYCALLICENRLAEAEQAWQKGSALFPPSPSAGIHDFDRDCFSQLRQSLDQSLRSQKV